MRNLLLKHPQIAKNNSATKSGGSQRDSYHHDNKSSFKKMSSFATSQHNSQSGSSSKAGGDCTINSNSSRAYLKADSKKYIQNLKANNNFGGN